MLKLIAIISLLVSASAAQSAPQKIVDAEQAFARLAAEKGTKAAFLANMTDDAVVFNPERVNARSNWSGRKESTALLTWDPNFADIASNGAIGYTTGNWEYRPKGKADSPVAFGDFVTIWAGQPDGTYKWLIDMGVSHDKPAKYSTEWTAPKSDHTSKSPTGLNAATQGFAEIASKKGLAAAYKAFDSDDVRSYRDGKFPFIGKATALAQATVEVGTFVMETDGAHQAANLAYLLTRYTRRSPDGKTEKGNTLQIWKFIGGKWRIVLDVINPVPSK
ncbi:MAG: hypothetical protein ABJA02_12425 [Acidobacteriota bacterium]